MSHTILLVDDEPNLLAALQRALRKEPYTVVTATSARQGWIILKGRLIDVVISDQDMPEVSGTVLLAQVRKTFPDTIRFMLTGKATLEVAMQAINAGAISRFFTKPYNHEDLAAAIRQSLDQKDLLAEARRLMEVNKRPPTVLESLERRHPELTTVRRDRHGVIIAEQDDTSIDELLSQLRRGATE
jgi:two-component system, probable response regulator PhcQ